MLKFNLKKFLIKLCLLTAFLKTALACRGKLLAVGVSEEEKEIILKEHNKLRQMVATGRFPGQPGAENMREIVWDDELAEKAQIWAENCEFRHDPHRTINRFTMGQNLAIIWSTIPLAPDDGDFPSRIKSWFNEVQLYSFGDAWSKKTGHYSQLVWGETSLVGCGYSEYKDERKYNKLYVCNYGPGGNVVGYKPYEVGKPSCATYGMKPSLHYPGLCAAPGESTELSTNAIDTYDYNKNNKVTYSYNSYKTYKSKQQTSQYTTTNTQYKYNTNPNNNNNNETPFSNKYEHHQQAYNIQQTQKQTSSSSATATSKQISSGFSGFSFGPKPFGSLQSLTTEPPQLLFKSWNKLESYKPVSEDFKRAVQKHTLLRTSLAQSPSLENQQQQQQNEQKTEDQTKPPSTRGWSLLTWRG